VGTWDALQGMWAKTLGLGDYYYELGVQVRMICLAARKAEHASAK